MHLQFLVAIFDSASFLTYMMCLWLTFGDAAAVYLRASQFFTCLLLHTFVYGKDFSGRDKKRTQTTFEYLL